MVQIDRTLYGCREEKQDLKYRPFPKSSSRNLSLNPSQLTILPIYMQYLHELLMDVLGCTRLLPPVDVFPAVEEP